MKQLVLSELHQSLGGKMVEFAGYYMPLQYEGVKSEHHTVRNDVGVFDVSHMGEVFVSGKNALDFLQYITTNDVSKLTPGKIQYTCLPNAVGGIVDDFLLYMIGENNYLLVVNASNMDKDLAWINKHNTFGCTINNQSDNYSLLAVQGPNSIELLQELTEINLSEIEVEELEGHTNKIELTDEMGINMIYPNIDSFTATGITDITAENMLEVISSCVGQIYDKKGEEVFEAKDQTKEELIEFIEQLNSKQFKDVQNFFDTMPKLKHVVTVENPKTKVKSDILLQGLNDFFV
jgi:aminomethyltransferase